MSRSHLAANRPTEVSISPVPCPRLLTRRRRRASRAGGRRWCPWRARRSPRTAGRPRRGSKSAAWAAEAEEADEIDSMSVSAASDGQGQKCVWEGRRHTGADHLRKSA